MSGSYTLIWYGDLVKSLVRRAGKGGIRAAGERLLEGADRNVPYLSGRLAATGKVSVADEGASNAGAVYYDTVYAARLHEHPEYTFRNGRSGKWVSRAIQEDGDAALRALADQIEGVL